MATTGTWPLQSWAPEARRGCGAYRRGEERDKRCAGTLWGNWDVLSGQSHQFHTSGWPSVSHSRQVSRIFFSWVLLTSKISNALQIVRNVAVVRVVWLGRWVWWECWPMWNDRNVKGEKWLTDRELSPPRGPVMRSRLPHSNNLWEVKHKHMSAPQTLNQDEYVRVIRIWEGETGRVCEKDTLQVRRTVSLSAIIQTKTLLNFLFIYFKIKKLQRGQRSHFRNSLNVSKETKHCITLSFVQRLNLSPKTNQNAHTVFEPNSGYI